MYTVTSLPFESLTRATLRIAEFGFLGVMVLTWIQTPCFCGHLSRTGALLFLMTFLRPLRTNWLIVGIGISDLWLGDWT